MSPSPPGWRRSSTRSRRGGARGTGRAELAPDEEAGVACDKGGRVMVVRRWKGSRYIACSGYPECRNSLPYGTGVGCPECGEGEMVERSSRAGKMFYSCSRYPECRFASWSRPVEGPCPGCGYPALAEKGRKGGGGGGGRAS